MIILEGFDTDPSEIEREIEYWQIAMIEKLHETSLLKNEILHIDTMTYIEANEVILLLQNSQIDPIDAG